MTLAYKARRSNWPLQIVQHVRRRRLCRTTLPTSKPRAIHLDLRLLQGFANPTAVFQAATVALLPCYALLLTRPNSSLVRSNKVELALVATLGSVYTAIALSWLSTHTWAGIMSAFTSCSPLPNMQLLADIMREPCVTLFAWLHLLLLDFYQARQVALDGLNEGVSTAHSIILCFMCGPLGLLSHMVTKRATSILQQMRSGHKLVQSIHTDTK